MAVAFSVGDVVTPSLESSGTDQLARAALGPGVQPFGGIVTGKVYGGTVPGGPVNVQWSGNNGSFPATVTGVEAPLLDILLDAESSFVDQLLGRVVRVMQDVSQESPELTGTVVSLYIRQLGGDDAAQTPTLALIRTADGFYRELQADQLEVAPGR